jgi:thioredoxin 2
MKNNIVRCAHCGTLNRIKAERLTDDPICGSCKNRLTWIKAPIHADDTSFEKAVIHEPGWVLVDFWSLSCGYCRMMDPHLDKIAHQYAGLMKVVKINVSEAQQTASRHGIQGVPTLALYRNGQIIAQQAGAMDYPSLIQWIENHADGN